MLGLSFSVILGVLKLLNLNGCTDLFKSLLESLSVFLGNAFLNGLRCTVNEVLCLLKSKSASVLNNLDNVELLVASSSKDNVKLGLLLCSGSDRL